MLLGWSVDDKSEAVVVDINRENWVPRIKLQGILLLIWEGIVPFLWHKLF